MVGVDCIHQVDVCEQTMHHGDVLDAMSRSSGRHESFTCYVHTYFMFSV